MGGGWLRVSKLLTGRFRSRIPLCPVTHAARTMAAVCVAAQGGAWASECHKGLGKRRRYRLWADTMHRTAKMQALLSRPLLAVVAAAARSQEQGRSHPVHPMGALHQLGRAAQTGGHPNLPVMAGCAQWVSTRSGGGASPRTATLGCGFLLGVLGDQDFDMPVRALQPWRGPRAVVPS
jgi:hypothetical protein